MGWYPWHAHNGYLEIVLDLGVIGLSILLITLMTKAFIMLRFALKSHSGLALWPAVYLIFFLIYNIPESCLFRHAHYMWLIFIACTVNAVRGEESLRTRFV